MSSHLVISAYQELYFLITQPKHMLWVLKRSRWEHIEKIIYGDNSTKRYRNILRHELKLKWIKLLQTPHPLGFNDNIYHEGNISRLPDFDVFSLLDIRKRNNRSHG